MKRHLMFLKTAVIVLSIAACTMPPLSAQTGGGRVAFGVGYGLNKYWGDFTDNQFWQGGEVFLRWNIISEFSLQGVFGLNQLRYKVNEADLRGYPQYFGAYGNGPGTGVYPGEGSAINREELNTIRVNTYSLLASYNIFPSEKFVPYLFGGVGVANFEPRNKNQNEQLPNNRLGVYSKNVLVIPFGIGTEWYITDDFVLNSKAQMHLVQSDYLDDYAGPSTQNDAFAAFNAGFSYYIFGSIDCDKDGLTDADERRIGSDPCAMDTDGDQLTDFEEVKQYGTSPLKSDTDDDGLNDRLEVRTYMTDPKNPDSDSDGLKDGNEIARKTDPKNPDTDADVLTDGDEVNQYKTDPTLSDTDSDGLSDGDEIRKLSTNPLKADTDSDGLSDGDEVNTYLTNPTKIDTDDDKLSDGDEIKVHKTDPRKMDTDNDKLSDGDEVLSIHTNPLNPDTDGDTVIDGDDRCPLIAGTVARNGCPEPPKVGTITNFPAIYFIVDTDQFDFSRSETGESLERMLAYINQCEGLGVIIEGHASREGADKRNQTLSDMRAARIKSWLVDRSVDPKKIEATIGYGSRKNAVPEPDPNSKAAKKMDPKALEDIRKQNRRIAVKVVRTCD